MSTYLDILDEHNLGADEPYSTLERELAQEIVDLRQEREEDEAVIRVWRGRTLRAERFQDNVDWCDTCDRPQYVEADGSHNCASIRELRATIKQLEAKVREESLKTTIYGSR